MRERRNREDRMNSLKKALLGGVAVLLAAAGANAQETLVFATTNPEQHPLNSGFLIPWAEKVNAESNGAVTIELRHGPTIANHTNFYDRVIDDVTQIGWGMTVFNPGKFGPTLVSTLPFLVDSAEQGAVALCRMHEKGAFNPAMADVVPLLWTEFPQASIHMNGAPIKKMEDVAGKKIITTTPAGAAIVAAYGGAPLSLNITEMYEGLQRGTAEGTVINFTAFPGFRLNEVTTDHYVVPLGGAAGIVFMSKAKWDALSDEARAVLSKHSGCEASRAFGQFVDQWEAGAMKMVQDGGKHTVTVATPEEIAAVRDKVLPGIEAGFAERAPGGAELIRMFKEELAAAK
jgi:TRAP-type C4-dicarboxylate transport system substrate-binding protein